jgi:DNA-binding SARP family transcriptional activator
MNAELAERLAGVHDGARILYDLEQRGLFTYRLDADETRYRYHGLFRDFLERRLVAERSEGEVTGLHIHAASYFETHEEWPQAIHHYLRAGLTPQAARLIARYGEDVVAEGRLGLVDEWLQELPPKTIHDNARLSLLFGEACGIRGDWDNALTALQRAQSFFARKGDRRMEALALLKRSSILQAVGSVTLAEEAAQDGMTLAPESAAVIRLRLEGNLAVTRTYRTQSVDAAAAELRRVAIRAASLGLEHYEAIALHNLGATLRSLGRLDESLSSLERATRFWQLEPSNPYADNMDLVETLLALGDLDRAERMALRGIDNTRPWRRANAEAQLGLASVRLRQMRFDEARVLVESVAAGLPQLGCNRSSVYTLLADCYVVSPVSTAMMEDLISHLRSEADDPRYQGDVLVAIAALQHASGTCDGSCSESIPIIDDWDRRGQHFEARKRRLQLALAGAAHEHSGGVDRCLEALLDVIKSQQVWYLRAFIRPLVNRASDLAQTIEGAEALCQVVAVDPEHWRPAIAAALPAVDRSVRSMLLRALSNDGAPETIGLLKNIRGHDAEDVRAKLIREHADRIFVKAFGSLRIRRGDQTGPEISIGRPRQRALLGYLVARIENPPSRDQLIEALWPEADPDDGVNSLNQSVYQLRRVIDPRYRDGDAPQYVISTVDTVRLDSALVRTDLQEFRAAARELERGAGSTAGAMAHQLIEYVDGEFLADLVYEDWAEKHRLAVHAEVQQALVHLTHGSWLTNRPDLGLRAALKLAELDAYDEHAHLAIARCLQAMGRHEAARQVVRRFIARLHDDLGEAPESDFSSFGPEHLTARALVK